MHCVITTTADHSTRLNRLAVGLLCLFYEYQIKTTSSPMGCIAYGRETARRLLRFRFTSAKSHNIAFLSHPMGHQGQYKRALSESFNAKKL